MQTSEDGETVYRWVEDAAVLSGRLYAVVSGDFTNDYRAQLAAFDVSTGKGELLQTGDEQLEGLVPYRAGELLLLLRGEDGSLNAVAYDPAARALGETFATFEEGYAAGVVYSEAQDACYYVQSATVLRLPRDGQPEIAAYLPEAYVGDGLLLADGRYAARLSQSLYVSSLDPADLPERVLVVQGGVDDEVARAFHERYPDVPVVPAEVYFESAAGIAQAITGGEQGIDVFTLDMEGGVRELIDKDYALDLSASEAISRFTQSLYPALADAVRTKDGAPAAVYSYVSAENLLAVDTALWARYDLGRIPEDLRGAARPDRPLGAGFCAGQPGRRPVQLLRRARAARAPGAGELHPAIQPGGRSGRFYEPRPAGRAGEDRGPAPKRGRLGIPVGRRARGAEPAEQQGVDRQPVRRPLCGGEDHVAERGRGQDPPFAHAAL